MKKLGFIAAILIVGFVVWGFLYPSGSWRYRLTIEVETPEGTKSGSSVVEVRVADVPKLTPEMGASISVRGEAVAVDLGVRGVLFALLSKQEFHDYSPYIVYLMFPHGRNNGGHYDAQRIEFYSKLFAGGQGTKHDVPIDKLPTLVRFRDINDPMTVELVDPNNLAKSLGEGVRLRSASIEMVDAGTWPSAIFGISGEPITSEIEKRLVWLKQENPIFVDWHKYSYDHPLNRINGASFLRKGIF
jgi:hypothetical protein